MKNKETAVSLTAETEQRYDVAKLMDKREQATLKISQLLRK
jgi:hypothetical protein